jgi:hypothetical protein
VSGQEIPADFEAFVSAHARRLRAACAELAGNDQVAANLQLDLLAAVAVRWRRWWRRPGQRERAGLQQLDHLLRREIRSWHLHPAQPAAPDRLRMVPVGPPAARPVEAETDPDAPVLARAAWQHGDRLRRRGRVTIAGAGVVVALLAAIGPHATPIPVPPPPAPEPLPPGVALLPGYDDLDQLAPATTYPLPATVPTAPSTVAALSTLASAPVARASALVGADGNKLIVVAADRELRQVDDPALAGARLVTTSLAPDGTHAALPKGSDVLVVDIATGKVRVVPAGAVQPDAPVLTWRTPTEVVVPGPDGARDVDVTTGTVRSLTGISGLDVITTEPASGRFTELVAFNSTAGQAPRIRLWRNDVFAPPPDLEDRPIFGPQWIGNWIGPGWSSSTMVVRDCAVFSLHLPARYGPAQAAVGAVLLNGIYRGTLVGLDNSRLDVLGFFEPLVAAVAVRSPTGGTTILAWQPTGTITRVTTFGTPVQVSLANLLPPS